VDIPECYADFYIIVPIFDLVYPLLRRKMPLSAFRALQMDNQRIRLQISMRPSRGANKQKSPSGGWTYTPMNVCCAKAHKGKRKKPPAPAPLILKYC
jgi:hypothetical protein